MTNAVDAKPDVELIMAQKPRYLFPFTWSMVQGPGESDENMLARTHAGLANLLNHDDFVLVREKPALGNVVIKTLARAFIMESHDPTKQHPVIWSTRPSLGKPPFIVPKVRVTAHCRSACDQMLVKLNYG